MMWFTEHFDAEIERLEEENKQLREENKRQRSLIGVIGIISTENRNDCVLTLQQIEEMVNRALKGGM